jgi:hypothetical protein
MRWTVVPQPVGLASRQIERRRTLSSPHHPTPGQFQCDEVPAIEDLKEVQELL